MMTFGGVPILDLVLLVVLLGFGVEAYLTTRRTDEDKTDAGSTDNPVDALSKPASGSRPEHIDP